LRTLRRDRLSVQFRAVRKDLPGEEQGHDELSKRPLPRISVRTHQDDGQQTEPEVCEHKLSRVTELQVSQDMHP